MKERSQDTRNQPLPRSTPKNDQIPPRKPQRHRRQQAALSAVKRKFVAVAGHQLKQFRVNEQFVAARAYFLQHADGDEIFQVARGSLALGQILLDQVCDAAVGLLEDHVDQFATVDLREARMNVFAGVIRQPANGVDLGGCPDGGLGHRFEHEHDPCFPCLVACDIEQQAVVVCLAGDDVAAQIENGQRQQAFLNQVQDVDDSPGSPVAIDEGVNRLELVVTHRHPDQGVEFRFVVQETLPVGEQIAQDAFAFRRGVDHFAGPVIDQLRTGRTPDIHGYALEGAADFHGRGGT